jgi:SET domain-containing protein
MHPSLKITQIEGKGRGIIATAFIPKDSLLMREHCFYSKSTEVNTEVEEKFEKLTPFGGTISEKMKYNAFDDFRTYLYISMINHSCNANSYVIDDEDDNTHNTMYVYSCRDINEGEEVTISYLEPECYYMSKAMINVARETQRKRLMKYWGFECNCSFCSGGSDVIDWYCPVPKGCSASHLIDFPSI